MTVKDLIDTLKGLPQDAVVILGTSTNGVLFEPNDLFPGAIHILENGRIRPCNERQDCNYCTYYRRFAGKSIWSYQISTGRISNQ